jgi:two-component system sensor histidine kinase RegB
VKKNHFLFFSILPQHRIIAVLLWMRLLAMGGQFLLIILAYFFTSIALPLTPIFVMFTILASSIVLTWWRMQYSRPVGATELMLQLSIDLVSLTLLQHFSSNESLPGASLYLPAVAVAAAILPKLHILLLGASALLVYASLTYFSLPVDFFRHDKAFIFQHATEWVSLWISTLLIMGFVMWMNRIMRKTAKQLMLAQEVQSQSEIIVSLGTQAASAAHEICKPLSTMALILEELRHAAKQNHGLSRYHNELRIVEDQIFLCKTVLSRMNLELELKTLSDHEKVNLSIWFKQSLDNWRLRYPLTELSVSLPDSDTQITNTPALTRILITVLDNAAQAVAEDDGQIHCTLLIEPKFATIRIVDNGPGISAELLKILGHEPVKSMSNGNGIGMMLAFATARQINAIISISSNSKNVTAVTIRLGIAP